MNKKNGAPFRDAPTTCLESSQEAAGRPATPLAVSIIANSPFVVKRNLRSNSPANREGTAGTPGHPPGSAFPRMGKAVLPPPSNLSLRFISIRTRYNRTVHVSQAIADLLSPPRTRNRRP